MIPTKTVRIHKKLYDALTGIANDAGISVGSVLTNLATFGCSQCGSQYLVDKHSYHWIQKKARDITPGCYSCQPAKYSQERLAEVKGEKPPKIVIAPPREQLTSEPVS